jgi:hypothetical protein
VPSTSKSYEVVRAWRYVDPRTGEPTDYTPGDPYTGAVDANPYLLDPAGPDGCGPLIAEKTAKAVVATPASESKEN